ARSELGEVAAPMLVQQPHNQPGLEHEGDADRDDFATILVPDRRLAKSYFAARRETSLADLPTLQLPPVVHGFGQSHRRHLDIARELAVQDSTGSLCAPLTDPTAGEHRAADDALPKIAVDMSEDRRPPQVDEPKQHCIRLLRRAASVHTDCRVIDRGP